jgi:hypothetical protein
VTVPPKLGMCWMIRTNPGEGEFMRVVAVNHHGRERN